MTVRSGDPVPALERRIQLPDMIAYAGATWDWHRLHYDAAYLSERGLPAPVVDGQLLGALLVETVQDHLGPRWRMAELTYRLTDPVFAGETVRCGGTVVDADDQRVVSELRVVTLDEDGEPDRVAVASARAALVRRP